MDDFAMDIGEAIVASAVTVSEFCVIESHEMQDCGVKIVDIDRIFGDADAVIVGLAVNDASFDSGPCKP